MPNELKFTDTKFLKFKHEKDIVIAYYRNRKFIIGFTSILNQGADFTDLQYQAMSIAAHKFYCSKKGIPEYSVKSMTPIKSKIIKNDFSPFYKYVPINIFNDFIKKGKWQLGNIEQYRTIENKKQRDEFEGHSFINLKINNHVVSTICSSGFNYLVFCGTRMSNSDLHKNQFGEKLLYFPNVKSFADSVLKTINAKKYYVHNVEYNTLKFYMNENDISNPNIAIENILTEDYFELLSENLLYPSLFVKPEPFKPENEVRIIFEMGKDHFKPYKLENKGLLDYVEY